MSFSQFKLPSLLSVGVGFLGLGLQTVSVCGWLRLEPECGPASQDENSPTIVRIRRKNLSFSPSGSYSDVRDGACFLLYPLLSGKSGDGSTPAPVPQYQWARPFEAPGPPDNTRGFSEYSVELETHKDLWGWSILEGGEGCRKAGMPKPLPKGISKDRDRYVRGSSDEQRTKTVPEGVSQHDGAVFRIHKPFGHLSVRVQGGKQGEIPGGSGYTYINRHGQDQVLQIEAGRRFSLEIRPKNSQFPKFLPSHREKIGVRIACPRTQKSRMLAGKLNSAGTGVSVLLPEDIQNLLIAGGGGAGNGTEEEVEWSRRIHNKTEAMIKQETQTFETFETNELTVQLFWCESPHCLWRCEYTAAEDLARGWNMGVIVVDTEVQTHSILGYFAASIDIGRFGNQFSDKHLLSWRVKNNHDNKKGKSESRAASSSYYGGYDDDEDDNQDRSASSGEYVAKTVRSVAKSIGHWVYVLVNGENFNGYQWDRDLQYDGLFEESQGLAGHGKSMEDYVSADGDHYVLSRTSSSTGGSAHGSGYHHHHNSRLLRDLCILVLACAVCACGVKFCSFGILGDHSIVIGSILAGSFVGPGGLNLVQELLQLESLSEFALILLMFELGAGFTMRRALKVWTASCAGGLIVPVVYISLLLGASFYLNTSPLEAVSVGLFIALSGCAVIPSGRIGPSPSDVEAGRSLPGRGDDGPGIRGSHHSMRRSYQDPGDTSEASVAPQGFGNEGSGRYSRHLRNRGFTSQGGHRSSAFQEDSDQDGPPGQNSSFMRRFHGGSRRGQDIASSGQGSASGGVSSNALVGVQVTQNLVLAVAIWALPVVLMASSDESSSAVPGLSESADPSHFPLSHHHSLLNKVNLWIVAFLGSLFVGGKMLFNKKRRWAAILVHQFRKLGGDMYMLMGLCWCLSCALTGEQLALLPKETGAFLAGCILPRAPKELVSRVIAPLKDFSMLLFFGCIGSFYPCSWYFGCSD